MHIASQLLQSMIRMGAPSSKPLELQPGQVFKGTVVKLYPDQMALVQIGGIQVQAKLEAHLEAGQQAWLQVQPSLGTVTLKVLTSPDQPLLTQEANLENLLRMLGIANTRENRSLVQALLQSNLPVTKEWVEAFPAISQQLGGADQATTDAFLLAVKRNLPLTPQSVAGLRAFLSDKPVTHAIRQFLEQAEWFLQKSDHTPSQSSPRNGTIPSSERQTSGPFPHSHQEQAVRQLVRQVAEKVAALPITLPDAAIAGEQPAQTTSAPRTNRQTAHPDSVRQETWDAPKEPFSDASATPVKPIQPEPGVSRDGHLISHSQAGTHLPAEVSKTQGHLPVGMELLADPETAPAHGVRTGAPMPTDENSQPLNDAGKPFTDDRRVPAANSDPLRKSQVDHTLLADAQEGTASPSSGKEQVRPNPIHTLFHALGLSHERDIWASQTATGEPAKQLESVKSLLLQLTQTAGQAVPAALREAADTLLQHVTGQQLMLVQPSAQTISQLVMQIPIRTQEGEETAFIQVESRKKAGGQLDPENCRLFFHLQLQAMGTTMVDVSIVNRIVMIQVYNDLPWVETLAHQMRDGLADQLREAGYLLSGLRVQSVPNSAGKAGNLPSKSALFADYKGVDIRV